MPRKAKFVDTFAGIGGFRLGMQAACTKRGLDCECVASVEIDKDAQDVYEANFGDRPWGDITQIPADSYPDHDFLFGGFPCQVFSRNGKFYNHNNRTLGDDDRKNLCTYLFAILRAKQPSFFVFENVKEIQSIKNGDGTLFIVTLVRNLEECGYEIFPHLLNSADFGVPQQRKRMYFIGIRRDIAAFANPMPKKSKLRKCVRDVMEKWNKVPYKYTLSKLWSQRALNGGQKGQDDEGAQGVLDRMAEKGINKPGYQRGLREWISTKGKRISRLDALKIAYEGGDWKKPAKRVKKITPVAIIYGDTPSGLPRQQDKLYSVLGISPTIATFSTPSFDSDRGWRMLTPRECARLQGFPDDYVLHKTDTTAYKQIGNAVTTTVVQAVIEELLGLFVERTTECEDTTKETGRTGETG